MRKFIIPAACLLISIALVSPLSSQEDGSGELGLEIGIGGVPIFDSPSDDGGSGAPGKEEELSSADFLLLGHAQFNFLGIFFVGIDSIVLPPLIVQAMTSQATETGYIPGIARPGIVSTYGAGVRIPIADTVIPFIGLGLNNLYIYKQDELPESAFEPKLGVHMKIGVGVRLGLFGVTGELISIQNSFDDLAKTLKGMASSDEIVKQRSTDDFVKTLIPAIMVVLYL